MVFSTRYCVVLNRIHSIESPNRKPIISLFCLIFQVAGKNEAGQTLLVAAGVDGSVEGGMREDGEDGTQCVYVAQQEGGEVLTIDPAQLAQLIPDHVSFYD